MTTINTNSAAVSAVTHAQKGSQNQRRVPSDTQQRDFENLLKKKPKREEELDAVGVLWATLLSQLIFSQASVSSAQTDQQTVVSALEGGRGEKCAAADTVFSVQHSQTGTRSALSVNVLSGPLSGAEIYVAAVAGRLRMTLRAASETQRAALKAIRHKLKSVVSDLVDIRLISQDERRGNG